MVAAEGEAWALFSTVDPVLGLGGSRREGSMALEPGGALYLVTLGAVERRDLPLTRGWKVLLEQAGWLIGDRARASELAGSISDALGTPEDDASVVSVRLVGDREAAGSVGS